MKTKKEIIQEAEILIDKVLNKLNEEHEYHSLFRRVLATFGVKSPSQLDSTKKKAFFNRMKAEYSKHKAKKMINQ